MQRFIVLFFFVGGLTACGSIGPDGGGPPSFTNGVSTLAGTAQPGHTDGSRDSVRFNNPVNVAVGPDGRIYVADFDNSRVRVVEPDGTTSTLTQQNGFVRPFGITFDGDKLYVTTDNDEKGGHSLMSGTVWRIDTGSGDASVVANAIGRPRGIAALSDGRLVISDDLHHVVRLLDPRSGGITLLAGAWDQPGYADGVGAAARFNAPYGTVVRPDGTIVVCDYGNSKLRVINLSGNVQTLAGSSAGFADGEMATASFNHPQAIAVDDMGDLYVTDSFNYRVRRIHGTMIDTIAGDGHAGYKDADDSLAAELFGLEGIAVEPDGSMVYFSDGNRGNPLPYNRVRQVKLSN